MKKSVGILVCAFAFLFVGCDAGTLAPDQAEMSSANVPVAAKKNNPKAASPERPFKGKAEGTATVIAGTCGPPGEKSCKFDSEGTFRATHLGKGTYEGTQFVDWSQYQQNIANGVGPCANVSGTLDLTAANGDVLAFDIEDTSTVCEDDGDNDGSTHDITLHLTVAGDRSTGRFEGASGEVTSEGRTKIVNNTTTLSSSTMNGTISY